MTNKQRTNQDGHLKRDESADEQLASNLAKMNLPGKIWNGDSKIKRNTVFATDVSVLLPSAWCPRLMDLPPVHRKSIHVVVDQPDR